MPLGDLSLQNWKSERDCGEKEETIVGERVILELSRNFFTIGVEIAWNAQPESGKIQRTVNALNNYI